MALRDFILKRIIHTIIVVFMVMTVVFFAVRSVPGDPVRLLLGREASAQQVQQLTEQLGLNEPLHIQYIKFLQQALTGDLGNSLFANRPVTSVIIGVAEPTLSIALVGITIAILIAIPAGIISAVRQYQIEDDVVTIVSFLGLSLPSFFTGILLLVIFAGYFDILPAYGYNEIGDGVIAWFTTIILPATATGIGSGAILMRMVRSSMLDVLNEDYMRAAKAKGLSTNLILFKHGLQNALIPVVTLAGILFGLLLGGAATLEIVFGINGVGRLIIQSINRRDFPVLQGAVIMISVVFVLLNLAVDVLYTFINPKIKY